MYPTEKLVTLKALPILSTSVVQWSSVNSLCSHRKEKSLPLESTSFCVTISVKWFMHAS